MSDSYTVLWTNDRCEWLRKNNEVGRPLRVLFGGPHQSAPRFSRFGVKPGDYLYPVSVFQGDLYLIARMKVKEFIALRGYLTEHLGLSKAEVGSILFNLEEKLRNERPELGHLLPYGCVDQVAIGEEGISIRFDRIVPGTMLESLRFRSQRGERGLKQIENGKLKSVISLQGGVYRLAPDSAKIFDRLILRG
jgi:hypothetical protein